MYAYQAPRVLCSVHYKQRLLMNFLFSFYDIQNQLYFNLSTVLAQRGYFKEQSFVNYLKYLLYWKKPEYAKFLKWVEVVVGTMQNKLIGME